MPRRMERGASWAWAAFSLLGRARNEMPNTFTKQAAANAAVSASNAPAIGKITRVRLCVLPKPASRAW